MSPAADLGWYVARAAGLTAWWLATAAVLWGLLLSSRFLGDRAAPAWLSDMHRTLGALTCVFTVVHVAAAGLSARYQLGPVELLVPGVPHARTVPAAWGIVTMYLMLAVAATAHLRHRLPARLWRRVHHAALPVFAGATGHALLAGSDARTGWMRGAAVVSVAAVLFLSVYRLAVGRRQAREVAAAVSGACAAARHPPVPAFHPLTVAQVAPLTEDAVAVTFAVPAALAEAYRFQPGQHVTLRTVRDGVERRRAYSICSGLGDGDLRIGVRRVPGGAVSPWVHGLRPGDVVDVQTPTGTFVDLPHALLRRHVLGVAAGSGITPVLAVVRSILAVEPHSTVTLLYGNRTPDSVMFAAELAGLADRHGRRLRLVHVYSAHGARRRIDAALLRALALPPADRAYLCGPEPMVHAVRAALVEGGMPADAVHHELFATSAPGPSGGSAGTATVLGSTGVAEVAVAAGESLLEAARRQGVAIPYACEVGVCGTCEVTLVSGSVVGGADAAGRVRACQARLASAAVTVDRAATRVAG
ncbi:MAG TPA: 2Fe-2S iron-sulfur cluster-binding protein [Pilimelia sp.]|nr:2Fe-2S iron-sulfur cluster-binding protein [Pilimelia sp.]